MGMFDSVFYDCPCGATVEWQSKAGECCMGAFSPGEVPLAIAGDLHGECQQCDCGRISKIAVVGLGPPRTTPMFVMQV